MRFHFQAGQQGEQHQDRKSRDQSRDPPDSRWIIHLRPTHTRPLATVWVRYSDDFVDVAYPVANILSRNGIVKRTGGFYERKITDSYARPFFRSSQAQPAASSSKSDPSGVLIAGGGVTSGGGGVGGPDGVGGPLGGGSGPVGIPGVDGVPPIGKSGGMIGTKMEAGVCGGGTTIVVAGGAASGNSSEDSGAASSPPAAGISIASGNGSVFSTDPTGASEMRFPQRVRAMCSPSVTTVSPARRVSLFFVQKIWPAMR